MGKTSNVRLMKWSSVIATVATTVLALTALITVYLTVAAWKVQQDASRPYFVLRESPKIDLVNELSLELKFNNVGIHPAVNLSSETIVFDDRLSGKPIHHDESAIVNEIYKDAALSLVMIIPSNELDPKQLNINAQYVVVDLQYADPILNKSYNQTIYMNWKGVQEGKLQPTVHVRVEEKEKLLNYFQKQGIDPKMRS
ncbi:conserved exported hypothetical protein [Candidatus Desulfosporosinus infrequens]|uniref:Uncharacterized protein n=1 Tax=Candidatus Desulfosporosinus infrequens TaxID=2043169 RepID=A0A2U3LQF9_9FIRM|nr:conserved exported hypothetical protein [Candidatus Desulfosporosinus infrequens]